MALLLLIKYFVKVGAYNNNMRFLQLRAQSGYQSLTRCRFCLPKNTKKGGRFLRNVTIKTDTCGYRLVL